MNPETLALRPCFSLGQTPGLLNQPLQASARQLFGPRGVCRLPGDSAIWVADTGHHRLLRFPQRPCDRVIEADLCLGQAVWQGESRNAGQDASGCSFSTPVGVCAVGSGLAVADAWNHRVLIWSEPPRQAGQAADLVLGQADFSAVQGNRGATQAGADTLFWPSGVYSDGRSLWVADTGNRRVLGWKALPSRPGQPADQVLGQADMSSRDQAAGRDLDAGGMVWPHALTLWQGDLLVADAGANRIMCWDGVPWDTAAPCARVLGQPDCTARLHNRGHYRPAADSLAMPYGLASWGEFLLIADTANSRLLVWRRQQDTAFAVHAQVDFSHAGDNRWGQAVDDSLCWPYALQVEADQLLIADTGNNRVQLWDLPDLFDAQ